MKLFNTLILVVCLFLSSSPVHAELVDRVVAVVNDEVITFSDLNRQGETLFKRIIEQAPPQEVDKALLTARQQMLSNLIDKLIIQQRAEKFGISVSEKEVDETIDRILESKNRTRKDLARDLKLMGTTEEEFRSSIKNQILQSKLISYEVSSRVVITEEKMKEYYNQHYGANNDDKKVVDNNYHILQMGFTWENDQGKEQARKQAEAIREKVLEGGDFKELAKKYSALPSSVDGGDLGICKKDELATYMRASCLILKPGEVSPVIETPAGYQFFKLLPSSGLAGENRPYEEVKDEIKNTLYDQEVEEQYKEWVTELRNQAYIKKLL